MNRLQIRIMARAIRRNKRYVKLAKEHQYFGEPLTLGIKKLKKELKREKEIAQRNAIKHNIRLSKEVGRSKLPSGHKMATNASYDKETGEVIKVYSNLVRTIK